MWGWLPVPALGSQLLGRLNWDCTTHSLGDSRHPWRPLLITVVVAQILCHPAFISFKNVNNEPSPQPLICLWISHLLSTLLKWIRSGAYASPASEPVSWKTHVPGPSLSGQNWLREDTIPKSDLLLQFWGGRVGGYNGPFLKLMSIMLNCKSFDSAES